MRRCIEYCAMVMCLVGLMLASFASPSVAKVTAVADSTWTSWTNTVYYFARLSGPDGYNNNYTDLKVHITAVDRYELYINGERVDTGANASKNDGKWETVDEYDVVPKVSSAEVFIAVKVNNLGLGNGNGLMVDIQAGADWLGTTTMKRRFYIMENSKTGKIEWNLFNAIWYYYQGDYPSTLAKPADWYKVDKAFFDNAAQNTNFKPVLLGKMGSLNYTPNSHIEIVSGYENDLDIGSTKGGGICLRRIEGENLALFNPCDDPKLVDGDLVKGLLYQTDPTASPKSVDLVNIYRVNKLVLYTGGDNPGAFQTLAPRGFAAEVSLDNYRYEEMNVINEIGINNADNGGYEYAEVPFPPQMARYVRFRITATRAAGSSFPSIGEMMVYGSGYTYSGEYISPWLDLGSPTLYKNIDKITWNGVTPEGTKIIVQTRTLSEDKGVPSKWSSEHIARSFEFDSPEPVLKIQYRVKLSTGDVDKTPVFKSLNIRFSKDNQPLASGKGSIVPNEVPMGVETSFVYTLSYKLVKGQNIKTVAISVPNASKVDSLFSVELNKTLLEANGDFTPRSSNDSLYVTMRDSLTDTVSNAGDDVLRLYFRTKLLKPMHEFGAGVFNSAGNDSVGPMKVQENPDLPWVVSTTTISSELLSNVKAYPKVFTPNNDNKNDFTVLQFTLANTSMKVKIKIFSTEGTFVRELFDGKLDPQDYLDDSGKHPGKWDGKNDDGDLVPPGIYIFQVIADTDEGQKVKTGTVVVAY